MKRLLGLTVVLTVVSSLSCTGRIRTGAEILLGRQRSLLEGKRIGIVCNHTSAFPNGTHLADTLHRIGMTVTVLFSPEHGIRGTAGPGKWVSDSVDPGTGIVLYSLYGRVKKPTPEMLNDVDIILFDLQDVGSRYYTYFSTMALVMEAAAELGKDFVVLDRPNPINGIDIEGPVLDTAYRSFVGMFPIPVRHGLTAGEMASMIAGERWIKCADSLRLHVVPMEGWKRSMWYDETGLPWIPLSPNMKTPTAAAVYPGMCLIEGTNVSEGRGTEKPFEQIGAPWIDGDSLAGILNARDVPGVSFHPVAFTPAVESKGAMQPKYSGQRCGGISIRITDPALFRPVMTGAILLASMRMLYPDSFQFNKKVFDRLAGTDRVRLILHQSATMEATLLSMSDGVDHYLRIRSRYLLY